MTTVPIQYYTIVCLDSPQCLFPHGHHVFHVDIMHVHVPLVTLPPLLTCNCILTSYPGHPMFFNVAGDFSHATLKNMGWPGYEAFYNVG